MTNKQSYVLTPPRACDFKPGQRVVYRDSFTKLPEEGVVTSTNEHVVFVCFGLPGTTSQACSPHDLRACHG
jgi:hypothetical protein